MVLFFLRSVRSTLIIATAIPVSLLGAVAVMYFFGYTFNSVTMLALLLLIGVVVDDAIVVLENIFRHREHLDPDPISAAMNGSREVTFAVIAATLSLVSIFAPVIFIGGIIGQFFKSFAVVVTFGVLVSLVRLAHAHADAVLALPARAQARRPRASRARPVLRRAGERCIDGCSTARCGTAGRCSPRRRWCRASSVYFFNNIGKELAPEQDEGRFLITMRTPLGSSIDYTETRLRQVEEIVKQLPGDRDRVGHHRARLGAAGQPGDARDPHAAARTSARAKGMRSQQQVLATIRRELAQVPGARVFARGLRRVPGPARPSRCSSSSPGPNLQEMGRNATELQRALQADPAIGRMDTDLQLDLPQLVLAPDRTRSQAFGLSAQRRRARAQHADRRHRHRQVQRRARATASATTSGSRRRTASSCSRPTSRRSTCATARDS